MTNFLLSTFLCIGPTRHLVGWGLRLRESPHHFTAGRSNMFGVSSYPGAFAKTSIKSESCCVRSFAQGYGCQCFFASFFGNLEQSCFSLLDLDPA